MYISRLSATFGCKPMIVPGLNDLVGCSHGVRITGPGQGYSVRFTKINFTSLLDKKLGNLNRALFSCMLTKEVLNLKKTGQSNFFVWNWLENYAGTLNNGQL
jgi:hypothetical protein